MSRYKVWRRVSIACLVPDMKFVYNVSRHRGQLKGGLAQEQIVELHHVHDIAMAEWRGQKDDDLTNNS